MKQKLIELSKNNEIICDNCKFTVISHRDPMDMCKHYINRPCPRCGKNLLTLKAAKNYLKFIHVVNWLNKWFSWLTIFIPRNKRLETFEAHHKDDSLKITKMEKKD